MEDKCLVTTIAISCTLTIIIINLLFGLTYWLFGSVGVQELLQIQDKHKISGIGLVILATSIYTGNRYYKAKHGLITVRLFNKDTHNTKQDFRFHLDASITRLKDANRYAEQKATSKRNDYEKLFAKQN